MKDTYCVVMAGGIGSRFWPLSRNAAPKQFLDMFGTGKSLLRQTFERFTAVCPVENFLIVTSSQYTSTVLKQLPELKPAQVLAEPYRRNTAPCIAFANAYIRNKNRNAKIVVTPADHLITNDAEFVKSISSGFNFVQLHDTLLTLGIKPLRPETGYGYIQITDDEQPDDNPFKKVKTFTEKPTRELATVFYESGEFYWNSGIFMWSIKSIDTAFETFLPEIQSLFRGLDTTIGTPEEETSVLETYSQCNNISIDYGIMEKASNVYVQTVNFGWSDLGTWSSMYEEFPTRDASENAVISGKTLLYNTSKSVINIPAEKVAVIQGLNDYIIVDSDNALLICPKANEQFIKQFTNDIKDKFGDKTL
ncbi:MAG: mannose-1-phosphate guanylyltransferase [Cytophagaceae bacterium]|jgi:mannose-1-phosphate guanylyltransferase|nr:mannose-1-phosphate guanylyltransferase [Cytophagaceae bacterium]